MDEQGKAMKVQLKKIHYLICFFWQSDDIRRGPGWFKLYGKNLQEEYILEITITVQDLKGNEGETLIGLIICV